MLRGNRMPNILNSAAIPIEVICEFEMLIYKIAYYIKSYQRISTFSFMY